MIVHVGMCDSSNFNSRLQESFFRDLTQYIPGRNKKGWTCILCHDIAFKKGCTMSDRSHNKFTRLVSTWFQSIYMLNWIKFFDDLIQVGNKTLFIVLKCEYLWVFRGNYSRIQIACTCNANQGSRQHSRVTGIPIPYEDDGRT